MIQHFFFLFFHFIKIEVNKSFLKSYRLYLMIDNFEKVRDFRYIEII
jgi:hypothetical protein